jgi:hypothetical protein
MRQFMRKYSSGCMLAGEIPISPEHYIAPDRKRSRMHGLSPLLCLAICMHTYAAKIVAEARLEERARRRLQRLTRRR